MSNRTFDHDAQPEQLPGTESVDEKALARPRKARNLSSREKDFARAGQLFGMARLAGWQSKISTAAEISAVVELKNSNLWRYLPITDPSGQLRPPENFVEFCELGLGRPKSKIYEEIKDYLIYGDSAMDALYNMGIERESMRLLRKAGPDVHTKARELAVASDKTALLGLIDDLMAKHEEEKTAALEKQAAKHAKEKARLQEKLEDSQGNHRAVTKLQGETTAKLQDAYDENEKLRRKLAHKPSEEEEEADILAWTNDARKRLSDVLGAAFAASQQLGRVLRDIYEESDARGKFPQSLIDDIEASCNVFASFLNEVFLGTGVQVDLQETLYPSWLRRANETPSPSDQNPVPQDPDQSRPETGS